MCLGLVRSDRSDLRFNMLGLERDQGMRLELDVVPRQLVPENGRALECAKRFRLHGLMVLVDVGAGMNKDKVGIEIPLHADHFFQDFLAASREMTHRKVEQVEILIRDAENRACLAEFILESVGSVSRWQGFSRDGERDGVHVGSFGYEPREHSPRSELRIVRMGGKGEHSGDTPEGACHWL